MMPSHLNDYISNNVSLDTDFNYTAIIGINPSMGARSPVLWNKVFDKFGIDCQMIPLDVKPEHLFDVFRILQDSKAFLGGCIAYPFKAELASHLHETLTEGLKDLNVINCFYRNKSLMFSGTNTDGLGFAISLRESTSIEFSNALILGNGATAKTVLWQLQETFNFSPASITVAARSFEKLFANPYFLSCKRIQWDAISGLVNQFDLIINCTNLGGFDQARQSPFSTETLSNVPKGALVYDVNYTPQESTLFSQCKALDIHFVNGSQMNIMQAVYAFQKACKHLHGFTDSDVLCAMLA